MLSHFQFLFCQILELQKSNSDTVVISFKGHVYISLFFWLGKILTGTRAKFVMRESNDVAAYMENNISSRFQRFVFKNIIKRIPASISDIIICNSRGSSDSFCYLLGGFREKVKTVRNPSLRSNWKYDLSHEQLNWQERTYDFGFFGRMSEQKRPEDFVEFVKVFQEKHRKTKALMVGSGNLDQVVEDLLERYSMATTMARKGFSDDIRRDLRDVKVVVLTSDFEGMPNILIEALANGCKILSYDCPSGPSEIIPEFANFGKLVTIGDIDGMAGKAAILLNEEGPDVDEVSVVLEQFDPIGFNEKLCKVIQ